MPKTRRSGNYVELNNNEARKRRKVMDKELKSDPQEDSKSTKVQQCASENRNPNHMDGGSDDSDVGDLESQCAYELSPYEMKRLENIQRNAAMFAELNLHEAKCEFNIAVGIKRKERGLTRPKQIKAVIVKPLPLRQSLRLKRMDPDGHALLQVPTPPPEEKPLNPRKFGPIQMTPCNDVDKAEAQEFVDELTVLGNMLQKTGEKMDKNVTSEPNVESYEKSLRCLKIKDNNIAKVVPQRIFSLAFYPAKYKTLVFAGDKRGKLGIWDVGSSKGDDGVYLYEPHSSPINCMAFDPRESGKLYSCSYDGTVRCCDVNTSAFHEVYSFDKEDDTSFLYFAFGSPSASTILTSTDTGNVHVIDIRKKRKAIAEQTYCLHDTAIKCVDVHPLNCSLFVTSSRDRTVAFWDIRNLKNKNSKLSSLKHSLSVTSSYFSPLTGRQVLSTSMDDYITISEVDSSGMVSSAPKCCFRHNNHVGRWLTNFRATWDPKSDSYSVVGSMKRPRQIDIFSSEKRGFPAMQLTHEYLNSVNSLNVFHPTLNLLAGGNSSGKVYLWTE